MFKSGDVVSKKPSKKEPLVVEMLVLEVHETTVVCRLTDEMIEYFGDPGLMTLAQEGLFKVRCRT